ncbi:hypothetical protein TIFTF001_010946 [Ficus carica]|uniref:Uncharacterized protein n=1 Tax=Ficus carica TaxID=3494 RepID=A0AA87ZXD0_FICCA|nr:hypothetical protein TIFTF001_010946 [Ficus carica]
MRESRSQDCSDSFTQNLHKCPRCYGMSCLLVELSNIDHQTLRMRFKADTTHSEEENNIFSLHDWKFWTLLANYGPLLYMENLGIDLK